MATTLRVSTLATVVTSMAAGVWLAFAVSLGVNGQDMVWLTGWVMTGVAALLIGFTISSNRRTTKEVAN